MIDIDGSQGEGGGQILRTALALSAITGQPFRLYNVRAGRRNPGLAPQHLTAIRAMGRLCQARLRGDAQRSVSVEFEPQAAVQAGEYHIDVAEAAPGGSAGAVTLILQALMLPLALADGASRLALTGGTHVPWSPPLHYLIEVFTPLVARMGVSAQVRLRRWGFYPVGQGQAEAEVVGRPGPLRPLVLLERGGLRRVWGSAVAASLPAHIAQRMADRSRNLTAVSCRSRAGPFPPSARSPPEH
jgi:RNA 3'-terminal phosphate cyclase (ATP)